jgi:hypothetical protein
MLITLSSTNFADGGGKAGTTNRKENGEGWPRLSPSEQKTHFKV